MTSEYSTPEKSTLGKTTHYSSYYDPDMLFPIPRQTKRDEIGVSYPLPFFGFDVWNHYEVSWLNEKGKPIVAVAEIIYGCDSKNIIESKSMKLYFNTFNNTKFKDLAAVQAVITQDLAKRLKSSSLLVRITPLSLFKEEKLIPHLSGISVDELDVECSIYRTDVSLLTTEKKWAEETLCSDLLKSNCLVTHQPDWCSLQISYQGEKIDRAGLLRYIVSFRDDNEFHEQCIEKIFMHIMQRCKPRELTVYGRSTRRGGLDINSYRSTKPIEPEEISNSRLCRQ